MEEVMIATLQYLIFLAYLARVAVISLASYLVYECLTLIGASAAWAWYLSVSLGIFTVVFDSLRLYIQFKKAHADV